MSEFFDPKDKKNKAILDYFENKTWLIVHSSSLVRNSIRKAISQLGTKSANFSDAANIEDAHKAIDQKKPNYIVANKTIQDVSTIPLFDVHMKIMPNRLNGGFFIITEEASQSEIGWALEYEMDGIIALPLNGTNMFQTFIKAAQKKIPYTTYMQKVEEGREKYLLADQEAAMDCFQMALGMDKIPFEAHAFIGQIYCEQKKYPEAIAAYEQSVAHNNKYFKSLKKLSELYYQEKDYKKAYSTNLLMAQTYPTSAERIPELIRLSIINKKYEDIANYYKLFQTITSPSPQMQNYLAAGLAVLGKYFASTNDTSKGVEALKSAFKFSNGKYEILKSITQSFQDLKKSEILLDLFDKTDLETWPKEAQALYFQTLHFTSDDDAKVIQLGEKLLKAHVVDAIIYRGLIERSIKMKREVRYIENMVLEANRTFPECIDEFEALLKSVLPSEA